MEKNTGGVREEIKNRQIQIFKTSVIGIAANLLLVAFKAGVGFITNSIAIILDAVNNLSDALSSVITIIGMKLAGKPADKKHPMGYGRIEYLSSALISMIIIYAGVTSLVSSVKKIINPEEADYSAVSLIIIAVAVAAKLILGLYVRGVGRKVNSDALVASGVDALFDSIISISTLVAAAIYLIFHISLEAWLGIVISIIIIKNGIEILMETLSKILGERAESDFSTDIKKNIRSIDGVRGAYDLVLNNYGPEKYLASVHVEVPDYFTAAEIDGLTREIQREVMKKHHIYVTVGIYSYNTSSDKAAEIRDAVEKIIFSFDKIIQVHGFYLDENRKTISVDFVAEFEAEKDLLQKVKSKILEAYPEYNLDIAMDNDISD